MHNLKLKQSDELFRIPNIKVTRFFQKKIDEEISFLGHREGPLNRSIYPDLPVGQISVVGESENFINDKANMPKGLEGIVVHKYQNRLIFLPTQKCAAHCSYCFRQHILERKNTASKVSSNEELVLKTSKLISYLQKHKEVEELILSGGDPLLLNANKLSYIFDRVDRESSIRFFRIHTRAPIFSPAILSKKKIELLAKYNVRFVIHSIHPYEICDEVEKKIRVLQKAGVRIYNQFPLLRGINDHIKVLVKHLTLLDELSIRNLSIFVPEPVYGSAVFRIPLPRIFQLMDELNHQTPSWINSTRLVLDSVKGKVRREDLISYNEKNGKAVFKREGNKIFFRDLPKELDMPGDVNIMLWKD